MTGGTSCGVELWAVVDGVDDDGAGDGGEEVEGVGTWDSCDEDDTDALSAASDNFSLLSELSVASFEESDVAAVSLPLASTFRETPRRLSISFPRSPFHSKNAILRPIDSFLISSSSKNLDACSKRADREVVPLSSEVCDGGSEAEEEDGVLFACCHAGIEGFLDSSAMIDSWRTNNPAMWLLDGWRDEGDGEAGHVRYDLGCIIVLYCHGYVTVFLHSMRLY